METTKRIWKSPVKGIERFMPQNYCAVCQTEGGIYQHTAHCLEVDGAYIFYDTNLDGVISADENKSLEHAHGGCNEIHTWSDNKPTVTPNAVIVIARLVSTYCIRENGVYKLKSDYVNNTENIHTSTTNTANDGPTWAVVIEPQDSQSGTWIVSPNMNSWKNVS